MATIKEMIDGIDLHPWPCLVRTDESLVEVMVTRTKSREVVESSDKLSPLLDKLLSSDLLTMEEENVARAERDDAGGEAKVEAHERRSLEYKATIADLESKKAGLAKISGEMRKLAPLVRASADTEQALEVARAAKARTCIFTGGTPTRRAWTAARD